MGSNPRESCMPNMPCKRAFALQSRMPCDRAFALQPRMPCGRASSSKASVYTKLPSEWNGEKVLHAQVSGLFGSEVSHNLFARHACVPMAALCLSQPLFGSN